ncbi:triose-phosphate isomerase [Glacieibacterium frigidum]|uniref:Triosephosphate isomerase n=1 Tax=Glacieibacterium frigidum TaxID=2593303 RepID=A0A552U7W1_9SPHN|nr:triose-phosphate isomerase [Glacieibacterium frigidum]TRW14303.1 triose-phosphate isomerase [Glacieibacterium frigidum]
MAKLIVGNWKMFGLGASLSEIEGVADAVPDGVEMAICPPFTLIERAARAAAGSALRIGAQSLHAAADGAHTGDISAAMLRDAGATLVIVGHSERRADHDETDAQVRESTVAAIAAGLDAIVCVGETEAQRDAGEADTVVAAQLAGSLPDTADRLTIAYEPVWAIGTGRTPTVEDVASMHAGIRAALVARFGDAGAKVRILYGGSVKPANAAELLAVANVDGALVGGASLTADSLLAIAGAV